MNTAIMSRSSTSKDDIHYRFIVQSINANIELQWCSYKFVISAVGLLIIAKFMLNIQLSMLSEYCWLTMELSLIQSVCTSRSIKPFWTYNKVTPCIGNGLPQSLWTTWHMVFTRLPHWPTGTLYLEVSQAGPRPKTVSEKMFENYKVKLSPYSLEETRK